MKIVRILSAATLITVLSLPVAFQGEAVADTPPVTPAVAIPAAGMPTVGIWYSSWYAKKPAMAPTWITGFGVGSTNQFVADVNGDGKADAIAFTGSTGTWSVALSNGNGFSAGTDWLTGHGAGSTSQFLADVNGDGKPDAVAFSEATGTWTVALNTGTGFSAPTVWISGHGTGSTRQLLGDTTGDGKADAAVFFEGDGSWYVSTSTGSSFTVYSLWINGYGMGSSKQFLGDINKDGKADAIAYFGDTGSWRYSLSSGSSFSGDTLWKAGHGIGSDFQMVNDANGDTRWDAYVYFGSAGDWYGLAGSYDAEAPELMNTSFAVGASNVLQGNVNGDTLGWKASVAFFSSTGTWMAQPFRYTKLNLHDSWAAWDIKYKPLTLGSYQTYDSNNIAVADEHISTISGAGIDFMLFDATNFLYVDDRYIYERQQTMASRIANWNSTPTNRRMRYALAVGELQYTHNPASLESEAAEVWDKFVSSPNGGANYQSVDGKPLLVLYCNATDRAAWQSWTGDKSNTDRFTIRFAEGESPEDFYGWFTPTTGSVIGDNAMNVMPGWNNHVDGFTPVLRQQGDYYSKLGWDRVMTKPTRPSVVMITSFNEFREDNIVGVVDTSNVTGTTEKWYNKDGVIDNHLYWDMTIAYIKRLSNLAFGVTATASSSGESADWGLSRLNDGQLNSVPGSWGYTSQDSLTSNHAEWVQLDLGSSQPISRVDMYPRNESGQIGNGFPVDFTIQTATTAGGPWTTVVTKTGYAKPGDAVQSFSFTPTTARFVKITATNLRINGGQYRLQLNEVEVY